MFFKKKVKKTYDPRLKKPVIRASICTGEKVAGFVEYGTRHFEEVMLIRNDRDLRDFIDTYDIREEIEEIY